MYMALADLGLKSMLVWHHEIAQAVYHLMEHVGGHDAVTQQCFSPLGPRGCHLFASLEWHTDRGCSLEATDTTKRYGVQRGGKRGETVSVSHGRGIVGRAAAPGRKAG